MNVFFRKRNPKFVKAASLAVMMLAGLLAAVPTVFAQAKPDPVALLKELDQLSDFSGKDFSAVFTIVTQKPGEKDSVTQARIFRRDTKKQFLILILLPEVNKGQGYLREEDNVWFYDPTSRKFSHSSVKENLQNTKAKNSDFTLSSFADDYAVTSMTEGTLGKFPVWILDLKAKTNEVSYERVVLYIRKDRTMLLKREDYSVNGRAYAHHRLSEILSSSMASFCRRRYSFSMKSTRARRARSQWLSSRLPPCRTRSSPRPSSSR